MTALHIDATPYQGRTYTTLPDTTRQPLIDPEVGARHECTTLDLLIQKKFHAYPTDESALGFILSPRRQDDLGLSAQSKISAAPVSGAPRQLRFRSPASSDQNWEFP